MRYSRTKAIIRATLENGDHVMVKFVKQYGAAAHRLLAKFGLAPKLLICTTEHGKAPTEGRLFMVVIEFIEGLDFTVALRDSKVPEDERNQVADAVTILHAAGLVFGDLCRANIILEPSPEDEKKHAKIVNID